MLPTSRQRLTSCEALHYEVSFLTGDYATQIYVRSRRHDWGGNRFLRVDRYCMILLALFRSCSYVECLSAARWHHCGPSTCSPITMGPIWAPCDWVQLVRGDVWDNLFIANWDLRAWSVSGLCEQWLNLYRVLWDSVIRAKICWRHFYRAVTRRLLILVCQDMAAR